MKQVIVMRKDLNMRKGKMVAQGAHASMAVLLNYADVVDRSANSFDTWVRFTTSAIILVLFLALALAIHTFSMTLVGFALVVGIWTLQGPNISIYWKPLPEPMLVWLSGKFTKVCVSVDSEAELLAIYQAAKAKDLPCSLIQDCGLTEFAGIPTYTCCAVGPWEPEVIDTITGNLKLL